MRKITINNENFAKIVKIRLKLDRLLSFYDTVNREIITKYEINSLTVVIDPAD